MPLAIFDIDGTLTRTTGVDDDCFRGAIERALGIAPDRYGHDWALYPHATDGALTIEAVRRARGTPATPDEVARVHAAFVAMLSDSLARDPSRFAAVAGAARLLSTLAGTSGWRVAIATGAWRASASLKTGAAGIDLAAHPAAFADDALSRHDITLRAVARAMGRDGPRHADRPAPPPEETLGPAQRQDLLALARQRFGSVVYIGDGLWDLRTSRELGIGFVGVRVAGDAEHLRREGADRVLTDFDDLHRALAALAQAAR